MFYLIWDTVLRELSRLMQLRLAPVCAPSILEIALQRCALQALQESSCIVDDMDLADMDLADIIYVDLYCPYITWLGTVHNAKEGLKETPADDILKVAGDACLPAPLALKAYAQCCQLQVKE